jgi:N-acetylmuramoyl-L-alanine amidase
MWQSHDTALRKSARYLLAVLIAGSAAAPFRAFAADTVRPTVRLSPTALYFSPNGDGVRDAAPVSVRVSEACRVTATVYSAGGRRMATLAANRSVAAGSKTFTWNGRAAGSRAADGTYYLKVFVRDRAGNRARAYPAVARLILDTVRPTATLASVGPTPFSPNGDKNRDTAGLIVTGSEPLAGTVRVSRGSSTIVNFGVRGPATLKAMWNGKDAAGRRQRDATYRLALPIQDWAGNPGPTLSGAVRLDVTPPSLTIALSPRMITPGTPTAAASAGAEATSDRLNITVGVGEHAALSRTIVSLTGRTIETWSQSQADAGTYRSSWDGMYPATGHGSRDTSVPTGGYRVKISARDDAGNVARVTAMARVSSYILVVLDPGHGGVTSAGYDRGAEGFAYKKLGPLYESLVNLQIAMGRMGTTTTAQRGVRDFLSDSTATGQQVRVRLTRTAERVTGLTLTRRASISNFAGPSVFVSIHNNDSSSRDAAGTETLYIPSSTRGRYLASRIQARVGAEVRPKNWAWHDRGLVDGSWLSLAHNVRSPMALVEGGFVNNPTENKLLRTDAYRQALALGISKGITDYLVRAKRDGWLWQ